jgi:hypothetical protein
MAVKVAQQALLILVAQVAVALFILVFFLSLLHLL